MGWIEISILLFLLQEMDPTFSGTREYKLLVVGFLTSCKDFHWFFISFEMVTFSALVSYSWLWEVAA